MTLGVRAVVIDPQGRVFLVKHSYVAGWHLPGGGVEAGRDACRRRWRANCWRRAASRRSSRRCCTACSSTARVSRRDHVAVFVVRDFRQEGGPRHAREIIDHGFFAPDALPPDTTRGTRARLAEVLDGAPIAERW